MKGGSMAFKIPTTQETTDANLTTLESKINQTSPLNDQAFLRALSVMSGMNHTQLYKYGVERAIQTLALTATEDDLDIIGINFGVERKLGQPAVLTVEALGQNGTAIPITIWYEGQTNGIRYFLESAQVVSGLSAIFPITSEVDGDDGNLQVGNIVTISTQIIGLATQAAVTAVDQLGIDTETDDEYRIRVLDEIRTVGGGSNSADIRTWAQEAEGVSRAYPYTGKPLDSIEESIPGDRTVYIEATTAVDPDGIAPTLVLDAARDSIKTDPDTGQDRQALGSTDETLFMESIERLSFIFTVRNLDVLASRESDAKAAIETALDEYARGLRMWVDGLDVEIDKNNTVTSTSASEIVNNVLRSFGATADSIGVGFVAGSYFGSYTLNPGELAKSGAVLYE
jgi:hypothetical protein